MSSVNPKWHTVDPNKRLEKLRGFRKAFALIAITLLALSGIVLIGAVQSSSQVNSIGLNVGSVLAFGGLMLFGLGASFIYVLWITIKEIGQGEAYLANQANAKR